DDRGFGSLIHSEIDADGREHDGHVVGGRGLGHGDDVEIDPLLRRRGRGLILLRLEIDEGDDAVVRRQQPIGSRVADGLGLGLRHVDSSFGISAERDNRPCVRMHFVACTTIPQVRVGVQGCSRARYPWAGGIGRIALTSWKTSSASASVIPEKPARMISTFVLAAASRSSSPAEVRPTSTPRWSSGSGAWVTRPRSSSLPSRRLSPLRLSTMLRSRSRCRTTSPGRQLMSVSNSLSVRSCRSRKPSSNWRMKSWCFSIISRQAATLIGPCSLIWLLTGIV